MQKMKDFKLLLGFITVILVISIYLRYRFPPHYASPTINSKSQTTANRLKETVLLSDHQSTGDKPPTALPRNSILPCFYDNSTSCESILGKAYFQPNVTQHARVGHADEWCMIRNYTREDAEECFAQNNIRRILFIGDSRVRYKYKAFSDAYLTWNTETCDEIPDFRIHGEAKWSDLNCGSSKVNTRATFWCQVRTHFPNVLITRSKELWRDPSNRPDFVIFAFGVWYCDNYFHEPGYNFAEQMIYLRGNLTEMFSIWATWKNTRVIFLKQEEAMRHPCSKAMVANMNNIYAELLQNAPKNIVFLLSTYDFHKRYGNLYKKCDRNPERYCLDGIHVSPEADGHTAAVILNYICQAKNEAVAKGGHTSDNLRYCCTGTSGFN